MWSRHPKVELRPNANEAAHYRLASGLIRFMHPDLALRKLSF